MKLINFITKHHQKVVIKAVSYTHISLGPPRFLIFFVRRGSFKVQKCQERKTVRGPAPDAFHAPLFSLQSGGRIPFLNGYSWRFAPILAPRWVRRISPDLLHLGNGAQNNSRVWQSSSCVLYSGAWEQAHG